MLIRIVRTEKKMRFDQVRKLIYDYPDDTIFNKGLEKFLPKGITRIKEDQSLVVPAENAPLAEMLRYKHLRNKGGDASLQQKGGENVRLSNGEHLFTPEEVLALRKNIVTFQNLHLTPHKRFPMGLLWLMVAKTE